MTQQLNILVSGAGIAGLTAAHFLLRAGHSVTIVERAPSLRSSGQNVDVRGHGLTVLQRMNTSSFDAEAAVREQVTKEKGLRFVDANDKSWADFPVDDGLSFTGEIEIMRGDLSNILYDSIKHMSKLELVYGKKISAVSQLAEKAQVELGGGWPSTTGEAVSRDFDLIIAADGISSSTRALTFGSAAEDVVKPLNQWSCWFSIPWRDTDSSWARWYNASKGRMILIRPDNGHLTRVSLWTMTRDASVEKELASLLGAGADRQKEYWAGLFVDAGWEAPRVLHGMESADDFYMQRIAQVKMESWSNNRTVLVGDAAYCPSPISGMGVTTAMTGAYVLAGEINNNPSDIPQAFKQYEEQLRPFIRIAQQLAPGAPGMANPATTWGIWLLHCFLGFIAWTKIFKLLGSSVNPPSQAMKLPHYVE